MITTDFFSLIKLKSGQMLKNGLMANILLLDVWEPVDVLVAEFQTAAQIADPKMEKSDQVPGHAHVVFIDIWKFEFKVFRMSISNINFPIQQNQCENKVWTLRLASLEIQSLKERKSN